MHSSSSRHGPAHLEATSFPTTATAHESASQPRPDLPIRAERWLQVMPDHPSDGLLEELMADSLETVRRPEVQRHSPAWWWPWTRAIWRMAEAMGILYMLCLCLAIVPSSVLLAWRTGDPTVVPILLLTAALIALLGIPGVRRFGVWGRAEIEASLARRYD